MANSNTDSAEHQRHQIVELLDALAVNVGRHPTQIPRVSVVRDPNPLGRTPVVYFPAIMVVGQGRKRGYLGDQVYTYDPYNYLVLSVPLPIECEYDCSQEEPLLAVTISVDPTIIGEVLLDIDEPLPVKELTPRAIYSTPIDARFGGAVIRLLECLRSSRDSKVLGPSIVREIVYLVLIGDQGDALRALARGSEHFKQIARALRHIHAHPEEPFSAEELARKAGMSVSVFHHMFKQMTATSPLQYVKRMRLDMARRLMAHEGYNAGTAASEVGYESVSQFSREFKRLFGASPVEEASKVRARLETPHKKKLKRKLVQSATD